ncbi:TPA: hypothetical protein U2C46_001344 [Streptococcus suis]|nr:hypothetical protein [Streptococcus suis]
MNALGGALGSIYTIYFLDKSLFGMTYGQSLLTINARNASRTVRISAS